MRIFKIPYLLFMFSLSSEVVYSSDLCGARRSTVASSINAVILNAKTNYASVCFIKYRYVRQGESTPSDYFGSWDCSKAAGMNMFRLVSIAYGLRANVILTREFPTSKLAGKNDYEPKSDTDIENCIYAVELSPL